MPLPAGVAAVRAFAAATGTVQLSQSATRLPDVSSGPLVNRCVDSVRADDPHLPFLVDGRPAPVGSGGARYDLLSVDTHASVCPREGRTSTGRLSVTQEADHVVVRFDQQAPVSGPDLDHAPRRCRPSGSTGVEARRVPPSA